MYRTNSKVCGTSYATRRKTLAQQTILATLRVLSVVAKILRHGNGSKRNASWSIKEPLQTQLLPLW